MSIQINSKNNNSFFVVGFLFFILLSVNTFADVAIPTRAIETDMKAEQLPFVNYINTTYQIDIKVGKDNFENSKYMITIFNPSNISLSYTLNGIFSQTPESIKLLKNGVYEEFKISYNSDKMQRIEYNNKYTLLPDETVIYELEYSSLLIPNNYDLGIWAINYNYNSPISVNYEYPQGYDFNYQSVDMYQNVFYTGKINFEYKLSDISCNGCIVSKDMLSAEIDSQRWFNVNWEKPRTPLLSSIVYLVMIVAIFGLIIKARKNIVSK